jgi:hypothetical protein
VCGTPGPAGPGDNDGDTSGPGGSSRCQLQGLIEPQFIGPRIIEVANYCQTGFLQPQYGAGLDFGSIQYAVDPAPSAQPGDRGMDAIVLPAI